MARKNSQTLDDDDKMIDALIAPRDKGILPII
jgi:hypothetical protein